jgi:hypothetical protein
MGCSWVAVVGYTTVRRFTATLRRTSILVSFDKHSDGVSTLLCIPTDLADMLFAFPFSSSFPLLATWRDCSCRVCVVI